MEQAVSALRGLRARIPEAVLSQEVEEETVLLDLRGRQYYGLDRVGSHVWALLRRGADAAEVVERLAQEYDAPAERLCQDVGSFLEELASRGLVELVREDVT